MMAQIPEPLKAENRELGGQARASADAITTSTIAGNSRLVKGLTNPHPPQFSKHFIDISSLGRGGPPSTFQNDRDGELGALVSRPSSITPITPRPRRQLGGIGARLLQDVGALGLADRFAVAWRPPIAAVTRRVGVTTRIALSICRADSKNTKHRKSGTTKKKFAHFRLVTSR
jgi:hypothetical protein